MIESALVITPPDVFPWGVTTSAGTLTPVTDPNAPYDWVLYAERDRQLAYRDVVLASKTVLVSVEISTIWNMETPRPRMPANSTRDLEITGKPDYVSPSGTVTHVSSSSVPLDATTVDEELFARDIVAYQALAVSSQILSDPPIGTLGSTGTLVTGGTILSAWSLGSGTLFPDTINPALPLNQDLFKKPDQNLAARDNVNAAYIARIEQVLKNPFEHATRLLVESTVSDVREAEVYALVSESTTEKIFQAEPALPGRMRIIYNKGLRTLQWVKEDQLAIHIPQLQPYVMGSVTISGIGSQKLVFVPTIPDAHDSQFWRQKAAKVNFASSIPESVFSTLTPSDPTYLQPSAGISSFDCVALPLPGTVRFQLAGATLSPATYRFAVLFSPKPELSIPGTQNSTSASPIFSTSGGSLSWSFVLPVGSWTLKLIYTNAAGTAPNEFSTSVLVTSMDTRTVGLRFAIDGNVNGDEAFTLIPITATGASQTITIQWNPGSGNTAQLEVIKLQFLSSLTTPISLDLQAKLFSSSSQIGTTASALQLGGRRYRPDVVVFNIATSIELVDPFLDISLNTAGNDVVFTICGIDVQEIVSLTPTANASGFEPLKSEFLDRAYGSILDSYSRLLQSNPGDFRVMLDDGSLVWTSASSENWINSISSQETRIKQAFRKSRPGDVGRPALLPEGLELILSQTGDISPGMIRGNYAAQLGMPVIRPLQAWMIEIGIYVAEEDFWDNEDVSDLVS